MQGKIYSTPKGDIHYWTDFTAPEAMTLVLLPGLTADHRLFDLQVKAFAGRYRILVWDAPGHGASRPFPLDFSLRDQAVWLHGILEQEEVRAFCLVGQSMGGYVAQCFLQEYPGEAAGFIAIDSAPLKRRYTTRWEIALLRHCGPVYRLYPWRALRVAGADGCADTPGRLRRHPLRPGPHAPDDGQLFPRRIRRPGGPRLPDAGRRAGGQPPLPHRLPGPAVLRRP